MRCRAAEAVKTPHRLKLGEKSVPRGQKNTLSWHIIISAPINGPLYTEVPLFRKYVSLGFHDHERVFLLHGVQLLETRSRKGTVRVVGKAKHVVKAFDYNNSKAFSRRFPRTEPLWSPNHGWSLPGLTSPHSTAD